MVNSHSLINVWWTCSDMFQLIWSEKAATTFSTSKIRAIWRKTLIRCWSRRVKCSQWCIVFVQRIESGFGWERKRTHFWIPTMMRSSTSSAPIVQQSECHNTRFLSYEISICFNLFLRTLHNVGSEQQIETDQNVYHQPAPGLDYTMQNRRETQPYNPHGKYLLTNFDSDEFKFNVFISSRINVSRPTTASSPNSSS